MKNTYYKGNYIALSEHAILASSCAFCSSSTFWKAFMGVAYMLVGIVHPSSAVYHSTSALSLWLSYVRARVR